MTDRSLRRDLARAAANQPATPPCGGACSSGGNSELLRRLQALDFSIYDTILYLDAYPDAKEALAYYHKLLEKRERLLAERQAGGCPPITATDRPSASEWNWVTGPWPWEPDAN